MVLEPVLEIVHLIRDVFYYTFKLANCVGKGVLWLLIFVGDFFVDLFAAIRLIGEEFHRFFCELNAGIQEVLDYIGSTTNGSINIVINSLLIFVRHIKQGLAKTELHTKLLASNISRGIVRLFHLVYNAILLIADSLFWAITLLPKAICHSLLRIGDFLVFSIYGIWYGALHMVKMLIEDIFRLTIGIVILFLLWQNRHNIVRFFRRFLNGLRLFLFRVWRRARSSLNRFYNRNRLRSFPPPTSFRRLPVRLGGSPSQNSLNSNIENLSEIQRCVICRDRQKCVVLWPCRHLCMCEECADILAEGNERAASCPLCRQEFELRMTIYT